MRIDGPRGLGSWLYGWFSGSFKGYLEGLATYAETASYIKGLDECLNVNTGGIIKGPLVLQGDVPYSPRLVVHGNIRVLGSVQEGINTEAGGEASHAEGRGTKAQAVASHAEGKKTRAWGVASHAEGVETETLGIGSHAEGLGTRAEGDYQTVVGKFNLPDPSDKSLFIVGNGKSNDSRSNAFVVRSDGTVNFGTSGTSPGVEFTGSLVKTSGLVIREKVDEVIVDRVQLAYQGDNEALQFRWIN